ncbi:maltose alpha-D-glucosyltransferase/ alpha-amylase [Hyunsoonleella jejuensis]|uniref:Maltose alpha-D-glucosyltransferase/ alpha-amylase n=1 Tax=Hyunsoonleella jejuensis TaxID=419940 RepID=A0A1H9B6P4_9FLAO|nr:trehalose synthase [Hyunsoonleella jejuensis]SEP84692.1 maltose alpha-D-glucosyltransferase/ alpha-amylase [Hyunsoonleella jejuensis]
MPETASKHNIKAPLVFDVAWEQLLDDSNFITVFLSDVLEEYIQKQRWYGGKASKLKYIELSEYFRIQQNEEVYYGLILEVNFVEAFYQHYFLPIAFVTDETLADKDRILPISINGSEGYIIDAVNLEAFRKLAFERILTAEPIDRTKVRYHKSALLEDTSYVSSKFMGLEQSNTSIIYNNGCVLKFFRRIYSDKNPDYEMSRYLSEKQDFKNTPPYLGSINIIDSEKDIITIALMQKLIPNEGDAWDYMLKEFQRIFKAFHDKNITISDVPKTEQFLKLNINDIPPILIDWVGLDFLKKIQTLAKRTAEMHVALGSEFEEMAFTPAHYNGDYEVWLKNRLLYQFQNRLNTVENSLHKLDGMALELAREFLNKKNSIRKRFVNFDWTKLKGQRIRVHGDYHLGQILVKDNDFYILDFEGEPESTIRDRKVKQPPLKDVAGLFRSFHYAIYTTIFNYSETEKTEVLFSAGEVLYDYINGLFLGTYISEVRDANLNIGYNQERIFLLKYALLEKAVYELGYELNSRPQWAIIPLKGISNIINN